MCPTPASAKSRATVRLPSARPTTSIASALIILRPILRNASVSANPRRYAAAVKSTTLANEKSSVSVWIPNSSAVATRASSRTVPVNGDNPPCRYSAYIVHVLP